MQRLKLEFWSDSFHEGDWSCRHLCSYFSCTTVEYVRGFIPRYCYTLDDSHELEVTVYGGYDNWRPIPPVINELIGWGKPDLVVFDPEKGKVVLAVEETAAVPTGNQALQRCERIYGSARSGVPFSYLLTEFGMHINGGVRTDSIWPTVLAIKLSCSKKVPSVVLHFSSVEKPEDYALGAGLAQLFKAMSGYIRVWFELDSRSSLMATLNEQYGSMLEFVKRQWSNIVAYLPGADYLAAPTTSELLAEYSLGLGNRASRELVGLFDWPTTNELPSRVRNGMQPPGQIKHDEFASELERLVVSKRAYNLSGRAGSRPQPKKDVEDWIEYQKALFERDNETDAKFAMSVDDFPESRTGLLHVTTSKAIVYLCDSSREVLDSLRKVYPRLLRLPNPDGPDVPALVYISNSLKPGRIFGDPFTGQLAAFSCIFSRDLLGMKKRLVIVYYPHQVHTQLLKARHRKNKGITILKELSDLAIFHGGVAVYPSSFEVV